MSEETTVTELIESKIALALGKAAGVRVDPKTMHDLIAEGHRLTDPPTQVGVVLKNILVTTDPGLKHREIVVDLRFNPFAKQ